MTAGSGAPAPLEADDAVAAQARAEPETSTPDSAAAASDGAAPEAAAVAPAATAAAPEDAQPVEHDEASTTPIPTATEGAEPVPAKATLPTGGSSDDGSPSAPEAR